MAPIKRPLTNSEKGPIERMQGAVFRRALRPPRRPNKFSINEVAPRPQPAQNAPQTASVLMKPPRPQAESGPRRGHSGGEGYAKRSQRGWIPSPPLARDASRAMLNLGRRGWCRPCLWRKTYKGGRHCRTPSPLVAMAKDKRSTHTPRRFLGYPLNGRPYCIGAPVRLN